MSASVRTFFSVDMMILTFENDIFEWQLKWLHSNIMSKLRYNSVSF